MSVLNQSGEEQVECPLCMEPLEVDDLHFYPCTCGYQICRFCWNRIREGENGLCPACRKAYPENPADFTPLSQEQVAAIKTEKKAREQKRRNKTLESRKALANVRVVQNNLVFVVGLPVRLADPEILKRQEYFGKYGKIHKVVINQSTTYAGSQGPSASAYVTYVSSADALRAIQGVNNVTLDGRVLKGSLGTTKYCANFMKNQPCPKPDCMYLHELGDPKASFTKEEMHAGLHQVYERKLHNQLLNSTREQLNSNGNTTNNNTSGNSSTTAEKGSSKDGNPSNFIPTTVVTSSHINVVNSSKSNNNNKKESMNGTGGSGKDNNGSSGSLGGSGASSGSSSGASSGSGSASSSVGGKEAWPSLGSSPPADSPARKLPSPKPHLATHKSQENGTSESSSPTQLSQPSAKDKDKPSRQEPSQPATTHNKKNKDKQKKTNSITHEHIERDTLEKPLYNNTQSHSVFENDTRQYLTNELDELESDRHSLLENHDLLDNSDHSLLDDDSTHNLLSDNKDLMMQRHTMLAGLVDNNHLLPKNHLVNGYGLLDRDIGYDRQMNQMNSALADQKELLLRERSRSEMLMRQNEMLARQHNVMVEPKHYMPTSSIGLDSASELLGANFHPNPNMLPFGMRVDNSLSNNMGSSVSNAMAGNSLSASALNNMGFMVHGQLLGQQMGQPVLNGYDTPQNTNEGRYLAENMDKFFTDFHKAQQIRLLMGSRPQQLNHNTAQGVPADARYQAMAHGVRKATSLEMDHKQRMNNMRGLEGMGHRAAGDGDDDLDFDPFKETQKALAEMMESELMQNTVSSGDNMERVRVGRAGGMAGSGAGSGARLPPGFGNVPPAHHAHGHTHSHAHTHQGFNSNSAMFSDWTQMDPAIMSTSVNFAKPPQVSNGPNSSGSLSAQQQELFARFNHLGVQNVQPNGMKVPLVQQWGGMGAPNNQKLWAGPTLGGIPLPPGFAPPKGGAHPAECIDAK